MSYLKRSLFAVLLISASWFGLTALHKHLDPNKNGTAEQAEDAKWIATSKSFLDRQACKWLGICGLAHYHPDPAARSWKHRRSAPKQESLGSKEHFKDFMDWDDISNAGRKMRPEDWEGDSRVLKEVPQFVLDHAPLIHLYSNEQFWPSNIAEHLHYTRPFVNYTALDKKHGVENLHELNDGRSAYELFLESSEDVEMRPEWLGSAYNRPVPYEDDDEDDGVATYKKISTSEIPIADVKDKVWYDPYGSDKPKFSTPFSSTTSTPPLKIQSPRARRAKESARKRMQKRDPVVPRPGGYSRAPAILILVDKGNGILDAFWFYFYSYNLGTTVMKIRFGNHIGDWEHSLIRFHNGVPKAVFFSAHSGGLAYSYDAVEKGRGKGRQGRPILYSAKGSHAMYATPGTHPYILPFGLLADVADRGPLWDPALNYLAYHFNTSITHGADAYSRYMPAYSNPTPHDMESTLQPALDNADAPVGWWWYSGHWGDKFYILGDWRQWRFVGQYHYVNGPYGPRWKNLGRSKVCQSSGKCTVLESLEGDGKRTWLGKRSIDSL